MLSAKSHQTKLKYYFSAKPSNESDSFHDENLPSKILAYSRTTRIHLDISGISRLDNKKALCEKLNLANQSDTYSDSDLIFYAYQKWEDNIVHHLLGDWLFTIWDDKLKKLFIIRDHIGQTSFYYYTDNRVFICSNSLSSLIASEDVDIELNMNPIYQMERYNKRNREVFYKNVHQLPSAHTLLVSKDKVDLNNYWLPLTTNKLSYKNPTDYIEAFREIYVESVKCRLNKKADTGSTLSSGLDSTSLTSIASKLLVQQDEKIIAYTWTPHKIDSVSKETYNRVGDESKLAQQFCDEIGNIDHRIIRNFRPSILKYMRLNQNLFAQPIKGPTAYPILELFEQAQKDKVKVLLTGNEGNFTVSYAGDKALFFNTLMSDGTFTKYLDYLLKFKKNNGLSWKAIVKNLFFSPFIRNYLKLPKTSKHSRTGHISILNQDALKDIAPYYAPSVFEQKRQTVKHKLSKRYLNMMSQGDFDLFADWSRCFDLEIRTPTIDKRLIDFCLNVPNELFIDESGDKLLFKKSMLNYVPEFIFKNKRRGYQGGNKLSVLKSEYPEIEPILDQFKNSPLCKKWLDLEKLNESSNMVFKMDGRSEKFLVEREWSMNRIELALKMGLFFLEYENGRQK